MAEQSNSTKGDKQVERVTPLIERALTELTVLLAQLVTTPFAFLTYNKQFRDQIDVLAEDDLGTAYPQTVARPLSFYVMWFGVHFLLSNVYWRMISLESKKVPLRLGDRLDQINAAVSRLSQSLGGIGAIIIIAYAVTLIIVVNALCITLLGYFFRCPLRFKTVLQGSAYAFGTFIFFQYVFIFTQYVSSIVFGKSGTIVGHDFLVYGTLIISALSVVRINQLIRRVDGTGEIGTLITWTTGTFVWQFVILLSWFGLLGHEGSMDYLTTLRQFWSAFFQALNPLAHSTVSE
jgi:hypothetical protein